MRRALAALAVLAGCWPAATALAQTQAYALLSPRDPVTPPPPLRPGDPSLQLPAELPAGSRLSSRERVDVGIGPDGTPLRVAATQRLLLTATGDYSFSIPAPATAVSAGPGSQSLPGLRDVGIVWQGFADRRRVLSAVAVLRPRTAAAGLPLRVAIGREGTGTVVRLANVAHRRVPCLRFRVQRSELDRTLVRLRAAFARGRGVAGPWYVEGAGAGGAVVEVTAPLHVTGTVGGTPVDVVLGGAQPAQRAFTVPGPGAPAVDLRVELVEPLAVLPSPRELAAAPEPLMLLQEAIGTIATAWAYHHYLATPDPKMPSETAYVYRSAARAAPATARGPHDDAGSDTLTIVLAIALGAAGLCGLAVLWARS